MQESQEQLVLFRFNGRQPFYRQSNAVASPWLSGSVCIAPMHLWICIQWVVESCAWWPKFTRCVSVEWCRGRGETGGGGLCAILIRLAPSNCAPAVELVIIGQSRYDQPNVTSPPYITQHGWLGNDQRPRHARPAHPSSCMGISNSLQCIPKLYEWLPVTVKRTQASPLCPPRN